MNKLILFLIFTLFCGTISPQQEKESHHGKLAPNFKGTNLDNKSVELSKIIGKGPILVSFWATWCKPCLEELDEYQKIYTELKERGFNFIAISTDSEKTIAKVKPFIKSKGYDFTVISDSNSEIARKYYAYQIPFSFIIDKTGKIIYSHMGFMKGDEKKIKSIVEELLTN
jgi:peroxiredoxin